MVQLDDLDAVVAALAEQSDEIDELNALLIQERQARQEADAALKELGARFRREVQAGQAAEQYAEGLAERIADLEEFNTRAARAAATKEARAERLAAAIRATLNTQTRVAASATGGALPDMSSAPLYADLAPLAQALAEED